MEIDISTNNNMTELEDDMSINSPKDFTILELDLPPEFTEMSPSSQYCVIAYSILFIMSIIGNVYLFISVTHQLRLLRSRTNLLLLNLCIADLIVTLFLMPMEIVWRITIQWYGGDIICKLCQFFRALGLYSSSLIVVCISVDRFFAIVYPLKYVGATKRVRLMLWGAWTLAAISALPQIFVFQLTTHPKYPSFSQCVSRNFLRGGDHDEEFMYNLFSVSILYLVPLLVIIFTYSMIICQIHRKSKTSSVALAVDRCPHVDVNVKKIIQQKVSPITTITTTKELQISSSSKIQSAISHLKLKQLLRQSPFHNCGDAALRHNGSFGSNSSSLKKRAQMMAKARVRTLKLTLRILITFLVCWTPYVIMTLWYMIDRNEAQKVDPCLQEGLFVMAVANSVLNPLIYGTFTRRDSLKPPTQPPQPLNNNYRSYRSFKAPINALPPTNSKTISV